MYCNGLLRNKDILLESACLAKKQQNYNLLSSIWPGRGSYLPYISYELCMLIIGR